MVALNQFAVYQFKQIPENRSIRFRSYETSKKNKLKICFEQYKQIYFVKVLKDDTLEKIKERLVKKPPRSFAGHTVSVSDVLSLNREGVLRPIMWRRVVLQYYLDLFIIVHQVRLFALIQLIFMWKVKRENGWPLTVLLWRERNSV